MRKKAGFQGFDLVPVSNYLPKITVDNDSNKNLIKGPITNNKEQLTNAVYKEYRATSRLSEP